MFNDDEDEDHHDRPVDEGVKYTGSTGRGYDMGRRSGDDIGDNGNDNDYDYDDGGDGDDDDFWMSLDQPSIVEVAEIAMKSKQTRAGP